MLPLWILLLIVSVTAQVYYVPINGTIMAPPVTPSGSYVVRMPVGTFPGRAIVRLRMEGYCTAISGGSCESAEMTLSMDRLPNDTELFPHYMAAHCEDACKQLPAITMKCYITPRVTGMVADIDLGTAPFVNFTLSGVLNLGQCPYYTYNATLSLSYLGTF